MNYKRLNAIIIKNRHSLLFVIETLNRFYEAKRFIKLDLENVYYHIQIQRDDE